MQMLPVFMRVRERQNRKKTTLGIYKEKALSMPELINISVTVRILHKMPLVTYNLSTECENVNTANRDLHQR